ncbi:CapA family protein [Porphyromonas pogonae]|uniref:CapA family protein n=1 Tax=Porphyromonas pogonae TaxID=867595 RepID=UPI002E77B13E|nr:CapA family protein [Porphyromonas pogonae]
MNKNLTRHRSFQLIGILWIFTLTSAAWSCTRRSADSTLFAHKDSLTGKDGEKKEIILTFVGDIMAHMPQITAAHQGQGIYYFDDCFTFIKPVVEKADVAIANLETTLAGKPYTGYPQFSAPDALTAALKRTGFDVLTTANNHCCDRGAKGIKRTLQVIKKQGFHSTGTFTDTQDKNKRNPLMMQVKGVKFALLAYTYDTNGIPTPRGTLVNLIDTAAIRRDVSKADSLGAQYKIVQIHWGIEYEKLPNKKQKQLALYLNKLGVDAIIGSHPHVVQESDVIPSPDEDGKESYVIYSLGNCISNQNDAPSRGGMMLTLNISRDEEHFVTRPEYQYFWVNKKDTKGKAVYRLIPVDMQGSTSDKIPKHDQAAFREFRSYYSSIPMHTPLEK